MNRREFLVKTGLTAAGCAAAGLLPKRLGAQTLPAAGRGVTLLSDPGDPVASAGPAQWALQQLQDALTARGYRVRRAASPDAAAPDDFCLAAAGRASAWARDAGVQAPEGADTLAIGAGTLGQRAVLVAGGGDVRGLVYALTELAEAAADDPIAALHPAKLWTERPANAVRSVMRSFTSSVEDKAWFHDRDFWRRYLSMLVAQRFSRFNLAFGLGYDAPNRLRDTYLYYAYPFLLSVPGYDVRATNLPDAERDRNLEMLRFVSDEAARRGLEFQLGLWTHAYEWTDSPEANHGITGLTPQTQGPYSRDALALVLKECPAISGVTFRIHGESGVPEGSYDLWKIIFDGCARDGQRQRIDMHAKGMTDEMIGVALASGSEFTISPKFWAEHLGLPYHQAAIRQNEMPVRAKGQGAFAASNGARSFLRYGYGDLLTEDRRYGILHRVWPGTQRMLLWGDPAFAAGYGRAMSFCGSQGAEIFEPLSFKGREGSGQPGSRTGYADPSLVPAGGDHEKFLLTYRFWGRLLYNPQADAQGWRRQFRADYGPAAAAAEVVLRHASRILPLVTTAHLPSASNNTFWPEVYTNMPIADTAGRNPYTDTPSPKRFGTVSPLDPQLFSRIEDYVSARLQGRGDGKYSPVEVAQWLEDLSHSTFEHLAEAEKAAADVNSPAFRRLSVDVRIQGGLGRFFGQKLRAGVMFALYERTGDPAAKAEALRLYRSAREAWAGLVAAAAGVYVADLSYGDGPFKRGNWSDRLAAIDRDVAAMEAHTAPAPAARPPEAPELAGLIREAAGHPQRPAVTATHVPPAQFRRGAAVALSLGFPADHPQASVRLLYRRVNQSESWRAAPMQPAPGGWAAEIPGAYTDSAFALQYYFEPRDPAGQAWLHPGLGSALARQPYYVIRQVPA
jgi:hypothetical protein